MDVDLARIRNANQAVLQWVKPKFDRFLNWVKENAMRWNTSSYLGKIVVSAVLWSAASQRQRLNPPLLEWAAAELKAKPPVRPRPRYAVSGHCGVG
jgi:hypothetical protein